MAFNGLEKRRREALFTDQSINGQTYTLQIKETTAELDETEQRIISIYSLSESYFIPVVLTKIAGSTLEGGLGNIGTGRTSTGLQQCGGRNRVFWAATKHSETTITFE